MKRVIVVVMCLFVFWIGLEVGEHTAYRRIFINKRVIKRFYSDYYQIFPIREKDFWKIWAMYEKGGFIPEVNWRKNR